MDLAYNYRNGLEKLLPHASSPHNLIKREAHVGFEVKALAGKR